MDRSVLLTVVALWLPLGCSCQSDPSVPDDPCRGADASLCTDGAMADGGVRDAGPVPECDVVAPTECPDPDVAYADIEPIITERCVGCHDGTGIEWPLTSYTHVSDWRSEVRTAMLDCAMPPADSGVFMTNAERQRILDWIRCGLPM